jgi:hypothetical protein
MKGIKEATKITIKKSNREMYIFCDLCFKIEKDDPTLKIINMNRQVYAVGVNHAMKIFVKKEGEFMDDILFETAGYYHLSKNADNSYELTFDKAIMFDPKIGKFNNFDEELIVKKIDDVIANMISPKICQFTKVSELKVATIATTLGLWVKDNDVKFLNILSPVEGFKFENMLVIEHFVESGIGEVIYTYLIMNFDNKVVAPNVEVNEQMSFDDMEQIENNPFEENDIDENVQESNGHDDIYFEDTNSFENDISQPGVDIEDEVSQTPVNDVQNNLDPWLNEPTF